MEQDNLSDKQSGLDASSVDNSGSKEVPDPQVKPTRPYKKNRRTCSVAYKRKFLEQYDACTSPTERGELLRREGLYHSRISAWRKQLASKDGKGAGSSKTKRHDRLQRENEQLKKKLAQANAIIDLQKKVSNLLGDHILSPETSEVN